MLERRFHNFFGWWKGCGSTGKTITIFCWITCFLWSCSSQSIPIKLFQVEVDWIILVLLTTIYIARIKLCFSVACFRDLRLTVVRNLVHLEESFDLLHLGLPVDHLFDALCIIQHSLVLLLTSLLCFLGSVSVIIFKCNLSEMLILNLSLKILHWLSLDFVLFRSWWGGVLISILSPIRCQGHARGFSIVPV